MAHHRVADGGDGLQTWSGSCDYIEYTFPDRRKGMDLQQFLTVKTQLVMKSYTGPW